MALWRSGILEKLNIKTPYIYTDPDVIPIEECPDDFIKKFLEILNNNLLIKIFFIKTNFFGSISK